MNQYLFAPTNQQGVECCGEVSIGDYSVFLGKGCHNVKVSEQGRELILVGYAVNVDNLEQSEEELCKQLLCSIDNDGENAAQLTYYWGGRWVVFVLVNKHVIVWNDACALKQAFFNANNQQRKMYIASQARYIAEIKGFGADHTAQDYINLAMQKDKEYAWPVDKTLYKEINRLLPNHLLLEDRKLPVRMRFTDRNGKYDVNSTVKEAMRLLHNGMLAVSKKHRIAVTLTAGWDSRLVFAACAGLENKIEVVTLQYIEMSATSQEITVAADLCKRFGFEHRVIKCCQPDKRFTREYIEHGENAHDYWIQMADAVQRNKYGDALWVKGSCNEILRNSYGVLNNKQVNAKTLCKLASIEETNYSLSAVEAWLEGARPFCEENGYKLLDLFYWEFRMGSWLSECLNEADVVGEMYSPFNVRAYLMIGNIIPFSNRVPPNYIFFSSMLSMYGIDYTDVNFGRYNNGVYTKVKLFIKYHLPIIYKIIVGAGYEK